MTKPVKPRTKRKAPKKVGRPRYQVKEGQREQVERFIACGMIQDDIARVLGISTPTLLRYFENEIRTGPAKQRALVINNLFNQSANGNTAATKHLEAMTARGMAEASIAGTETGQKVDAPAKAEKPIKLGKKQQAVVDAKTAGEGTEWGDDLRPAPFAVVNGGKQ